MLTAPFGAHALTAAYYVLVEPGRPVILDAGHRWQSVWDEQSETQEMRDTQAPAAESIVDEYQRRFDERNKQWDR
jgi:hypothetical protein